MKMYNKAYCIETTIAPHGLLLLFKSKVPVGGRGEYFLEKYKGNLSVKILTFPQGCTWQSFFGAALVPCFVFGVLDGQIPNASEHKL